MTRCHRAGLWIALALGICCASRAEAQTPDDDLTPTPRGHVVVLALDAASRPAAAALADTLASRRHLATLPPGALTRAWRAEGITPREILRERTAQDPPSPHDRLRAGLVLCRMDVRMIVTVHTAGEGQLVQVFGANLYAESAMLRTDDGPQEALHKWLDYRLRDVARTTASRTPARCAVELREAYVQDRTRHVHARHTTELRVDMLRVGTGRQRVPTAAGGESEGRAGWWALGAGLTWAPVEAIPDRLMLGLWGDLLLAWSGTAAASAVVEGGVALDVLAGREGSLMLMGGWRQGWTSADATHPNLRAGHPMLTVRGAWRPGRFVEIVGMLGGGYWLRGPLITDPRAWWWRASAEGRLGLEREWGLFARGTLEGLEQRDGPTAHTLWAILPGLFARF